jgi:malonate transporter and related proteins
VEQGDPGGQHQAGVRLVVTLPTAKTMYVLAHEHKIEEPPVAATISITTMPPVTTLPGWLYLLSGLPVGAT